MPQVGQEHGFRGGLGGKPLEDEDVVDEPEGKEEELDCDPPLLPLAPDDELLPPGPDEEELLADIDELLPLDLDEPLVPDELEPLRDEPELKPLLEDAMPAIPLCRGKRATPKKNCRRLELSPDNRPNVKFRVARIMKMIHALASTYTTIISGQQPRTYKTPSTFFTRNAIAPTMTTSKGTWLRYKLFNCSSLPTPRLWGPRLKYHHG